MKDNPFSTYVLMHQVLIAHGIARVAHIILAIAGVIAGLILLGNHLPAAGFPILFGAPLFFFLNWIFARLVFGHLYSVLTIRMEIEKQNDDKDEIDFSKDAPAWDKQGSATSKTASNQGETNVGRKEEDQID